jgi:hypothetical protein
MSIRLRAGVARVWHAARQHTAPEWMALDVGELQLKLQLGARNGHN